MRDLTIPKIPKWPFFLGDILLLALAWFIHVESKSPVGAWEIIAYVLCVSIGAWISITPFLKEYQAAIKRAEAGDLAGVASQIQNLEQLAAQIGYATSQWQVIRESADKTTNIAKEIARGMAAEVQAFNEFTKRSNEGEKATLRLEVDKLRRAESEWLQITVRMLDHVFALHRAASRSRQPGIAEQIGNFQNACRDAARRIGLVPFAANSGEIFDAQKHQLMDGGEEKISPDSVIEETIATGYTFQGKLIRPALVKLRNGLSEEKNGSKIVSNQSQLPLESEQTEPV
ncbi:MAG TPA: nucleotide exchange factor GrpE [Verrucomicrobiae bacterium]|jgi:molecular chaperone GrpE (heat shock protein)|nr:nucleotide exchange factor GrpE [Verrucomicrobiae bacterium]